jgi:hypothetical protein
MTKKAHAPLACHVCGEQRAFVEYGEKLGKDGRMAKWPIYEPCSKENHPQPKKSIGDYSLFLPDNKEIVNRPIRIVEGRSGPKGRLVQLSKMNIEQLNQALATYIEKEGEPPSSVHLSQLDYTTIVRQEQHPENEERLLDVALVVDEAITPTYRYAFLVSNEGK